MFKDRMPNNHFDLKPNFDQLVLAITKAVSNNIPVPFNTNPTNILNFPTLHRDLYKLALEGPYGLLIRQIFDQIFYLTTMHQMLLKNTLRIEQLQEEIKEMKHKKFHPFYYADQPRPLTAETIPPDQELKKLQDENPEISKTLIQNQKRMILINTVYLNAITHFVVNVATATILNRAKELNYDFSPSELHTLLNPVPRAKIQEVLTASFEAYNTTQTTEEKKPKPTPDFLATRTLHDFELNLVTVIAQNRDREIVEHQAKLNNSPDKLDDETIKLRVAAFAAEYDRRHTDPALSPKPPAPKNPNDPRSRFVRQETVYGNSMLAATKLVKSFKSSFCTMEQGLQGLHELHKKDLSPEALEEAMHKQIQSAAEKLKSAQANPTRPERGFHQ